MAPTLGIADTAFTEWDYHVHFPAGAIPKDGPSAGITILTALVSLLTGRAINPKLAMTGEITLRGSVLPVGGIKEKVLAAKRAGIDTIMMCNKNEKDLEDIPKELRDTMTFHFVKEMSEVLKVALDLDFNPTLPMASDKAEEEKKKKKRTTSKTTGARSE